MSTAEETKAPAKAKTPSKATRRVEHSALRYAAPTLICAAAMPVAEVAHLAWGHDGIMTMVMTGVAGGLTWFTHQTWHKRHEKTRALATAFAAAVTGWTVTAAVTDPFGHAQVNSFAIGTFALSAAWHIRGHGLSTPHEADKRTKPADGLGTLAKVVGSLKGAKAVSVSESADNSRVSARVRLEKPTAAGQVQSDKDAIASALSVGADQVSVAPVPGRADMVDLSVTLPAPLGSSVRWTPPQEIGMSVADSPLIIGMRTDGRPIELWVCGQDTTDTQEARILGHALCTGVTGSGKTETIRNVIVLGRYRRDFVPVVADPIKFGQSFGDIADALGLAARGKKQAAQLVANLPAAVEYRAELMGSLKRSDGGTGYRQWVPECWTLHGIPLVMVDIEEATSVLQGDSEDFDEGIRTARSVGIWIVASLQTAIHSNIERKTRGQFAQTLTHGCKEHQDAKFALSPATLEAGADPTKWGGDFPGSLYAELVGTPPQEWSVEARSFWIPTDVKRSELDRSRDAGVWAVMDPGTYAALSKGIAQPEEPTVQLRLPVSDAGSEFPEFDFGNDSVYVNEEDSEEDVSLPIPPSRHAVPFPLTVPVEKMSTESARALFDSRVNDLEKTGNNEIGFSDLSDLSALTGRRRSWVYEQLERLEKDGRLSRIEADGPLRYRIRARAINGHTLY